MVDGLAVTGDKDAAKEQIKALYHTFADCDCTMVEVCKQPSWFCPRFLVPVTLCIRARRSHLSTHPAVSTC